MDLNSLFLASLALIPVGRALVAYEVGTVLNVIEKKLPASIREMEPLFYCRNFFSELVKL
jgi:hypothetical protein